MEIQLSLLECFAIELDPLSVAKRSYNCSAIEYRIMFTQLQFISALHCVYTSEVTHTCKILTYDPSLDCSD